MTLSSVRPLRFIFAQIMKKDMQAHKEACEFFFFFFFFKTQNLVENTIGPKARKKQSNPFKKEGI